MRAKKMRFVSPMLFLVVFVFAACSDVSQDDFGRDGGQTLRVRAQTMADVVPWTDELEADRLTAAVSVADGIDSRVSLVPLSFLAGKEARNEQAVYPFLDGFGALDTTLITGGVRETLEGFCTALCRAEDADSFMAHGCLYQLAFLYRDAGLDLPKSVDKTDAAFSFFDSYFYGQPYMTGASYAIPVRFVGKKRALDVLVFLLEEDGVWKIDELWILRTEGGNGT